MKEKDRIIFKIIIIVVCTISFVWMIHKDETVFQLKQPKGEGIKTENVYYMAEAVLNKLQIWDDITTQQKKEELQIIRQSWKAEKEEMLSYESYIEIGRVLGVSELDNFLREDKYKHGFYFLKDDWFGFYEDVLTFYQLENEIIREDINILTDDENLLSQKVGDKCILTDTGKRYQYLADDVLEHKFRKVTVYTTENTILAVVESKKNSFTMENVWIMEEDVNSLQFFFQGFEVRYPMEQNKKYDEITRETVADLTFDEGSLSDIKLKQERINGRILRLTENELELEGYGSYEIAEECRIYRLYEELQEESRKELRIGYDFSDFVIEDGKICAALIIRKENMENIRVAIRSNNFASLYHEEIRLQADCDLNITYGEYNERKTDVIRQGEEICFTKDSIYLEGDRAIVSPAVQSGKTSVLSLNRNQGIPSYRGSMEIAKTDEGLIMINELLLEEYLYSVVPSEMPASYHTEALKAQAICARTYAYQYLNSPGLGNIGANVDDSVGYQVYNNIAENTNSTKAVKETTGQILFYGGEVVNTYYYSTSCGFGTDAGVWQESNVDKYPYLKSRHISEATELSAQDNIVQSNEYQQAPQRMQEEEYVKEYLSSVGDDDYEKEEPWYRWTYQVEEIDAVNIWERITERFKADEGKILTRMGEGENETFDSVMPEKFTEIYEIEVLKRREGGVIDELLLKTDSGTYNIISEYNIRYILNHGGNVLRQDGSEIENGQILPSAYFTLDIEKDDDVVTGYELTGGGYGHGVGMSQNGAKAMAGTGMDSDSIIEFYYPACELKKMY